MENVNVINRAREMARLCLECVYGNTARQEQKGQAYECVQHLAKAVCPFWEIYQTELRALDANATARA